MPALRSPLGLLSATSPLRNPVFILRRAPQHIRNTPVRISRRAQSTDASAAAGPAQSTLSRLWNSPIGVKTVHFWAPVMKWAIVIAGISDFYRPAEKLSLTQNFALLCTGAIWTRWCLIIKPVNYLLAAVNFFLGCVGATQVTRILRWRRTDEGKASMAKEAQKVAEEEAGVAKGIAKDPEGAAKKAVKV
ncbi:MAG: hypothetical protein M1817_003814 [Caeruleum heppii]|nr:MAG: hypothetical protein M1817_003814 [Caeruleum heppii]